MPKFEQVKYDPKYLDISTRMARDDKNHKLALAALLELYQKSLGIKWKK